jgi:hypothetical protein
LASSPFAAASSLASCLSCWISARCCFLSSSRASFSNLFFSFSSSLAFSLASLSSSFSLFLALCAPVLVSTRMLSCTLERSIQIKSYLYQHKRRLAHSRILPTSEGWMHVRMLEWSNRTNTPTLNPTVDLKPYTSSYLYSSSDASLFAIFSLIFSGSSSSIRL